MEQFQTRQEISSSDQFSQPSSRTETQEIQNMKKITMPNSIRSGLESQSVGISSYEQNEPQIASNRLGGRRETFGVG